MITDQGANCDVCSDVVDTDDAHFPHKSGCSYDTAGYCYCDTVTHPDCCTTCDDGYVS